MTEQLRILVGADGAGEGMKNTLRDLLRRDPRVSDVIDIGVNDGESTPYPHIGHEAGLRIARHEADRALLVCGTGMGVAMAATKVKGVRGSVAHDSFSVERLVKSNNAQVLAFGARVIGVELAKKLVDEWLDYRFDPASPSAQKIDALSDYEDAASAIDRRVGCSSISLRARPLDDALSIIAGLGFAEIDLGALPGVCDHVPYELTAQAITDVSRQIAASGLLVRSVNGDIGDLNDAIGAAERAERSTHLDRLLDLTARVGAKALVLPCGAQDQTPHRGTLGEDLDVVAAELNVANDRADAFGVELWTESLHSFRLCGDAHRAALLHQRLSPTVGIVMDFSHVKASGGDIVSFVAAHAARIRHVHLRDAKAGDIHLSIGRGDVDFAAGFQALASAGFGGHFALELETRDLADADRPAATLAAGSYVSELLREVGAAAR